MKNLANKFRKLSPTEKLLHLAPIVIWFSYFPNFQIGRGEGMNFEFSLPLIFAVISSCAILNLVYSVFAYPRPV